MHSLSGPSAAMLSIKTCKQLEIKPQKPNSSNNIHVTSTSDIFAGSDGRVTNFQRRGPSLRRDSRGTESAASVARTRR